MPDVRDRCPDVFQMITEFDLDSLSRPREERNPNGILGKKLIPIPQRSEDQKGKNIHEGE